MTARAVQTVQEARNALRQLQANIALCESISPGSVPSVFIDLANSISRQIDARELSLRLSADQPLITHGLSTFFYPANQGVTEPEERASPNQLARLANLGHLTPLPPPMSGQSAPIVLPPPALTNIPQTTHLFSKDGPTEFALNLH